MHLKYAKALDEVLITLDLNIDNPLATMKANKALHTTHGMDKRDWPLVYNKLLHDKLIEYDNRTGSGFSMRLEGKSLIANGGYTKMAEGELKAVMPPKKLYLHRGHWENLYKYFIWPLVVTVIGGLIVVAIIWYIKNHTSIPIKPNPNNTIVSPKEGHPKQKNDTNAAANIYKDTVHKLTQPQ